MKNFMIYIPSFVITFFLLNSNMNKHFDFLDENGNFTCEHCGEIFQNKRKFSAHMRKHLNDYVIRCDLCNKGFEYKSQYELHLRKHTGERPYRCHICAAGFTQEYLDSFELTKLLKYNSQI